MTKHMTGTREEWLLKGQLSSPMVHPDLLYNEEYDIIMLG